MRKLVLACMLCCFLGADSWSIGRNRLRSPRMHLVHAARRTQPVMRDVGIRPRQTMPHASILNQRSLPAKPENAQRRQKPGVAHIVRAAKESKMATVGITTKDIDVILRDKRLPRSKAAKLLSARKKLTDFVVRVNYARRRQPREFIPGMKVRGRVIGLGSRGAFVDIGCVRDAFLGLGDCDPAHWIREIESVVHAGQDIDVYVKQVGSTANFRPTVSLFQRDLTARSTANRRPVSAFNISDPVTGVVTKATETAVFVDIGAQVDAHLPRNFARERFEYPELGMFEYMPEGTNITAWVARVDTRRNRLQLSTEREKIAWLYMPSDANANEIDFYRSAEEFKRKFPEPPPGMEEDDGESGMDEEDDVPWDITPGTTATGMPLHEEWSIDDDDVDDDEFEEDLGSQEIDRFILDDFASESGKPARTKKAGKHGAGSESAEADGSADEDAEADAGKTTEEEHGLIGGEEDETLADYAGMGILSPEMTAAEVEAFNRMATVFNSKLQPR